MAACILAVVAGGCGSTPQARSGSDTATIDIEPAPAPVLGSDEGNSGAASAAELSGGPYLLLEQEGRRWAANDGQAIEIARRPFALVFALGPYTNGRRYAARVAVSEQAFDDAIDVGNDIGPEGQVSTCFLPGTGLAAGPQGYQGVYLTRVAHHYLVHEPQARGPGRVRWIRDLPDDRAEVAFDIAGVQSGDALVPFDEVGLSVLHFAVVFDDDLNQRIDPGELFRFRVTLK